MPAVITQNIYGSTASLGYDSAQPERAVRRHFFEDSSVTTLEAAIRDCVTAVGNGYYSSTFQMPLQNAVAKQVGPGKFIVEMQYAWGGSGGWGGSNFNTLAEYRLAYESVPVFKVGPADPATGIPPATGTDWFDAAGSVRLGMRPGSFPWPRPILRVGQPIQQTVNPMVTWASKAGKVNSNSYTVGGLAFTAGQLRFDGAEIVARTNTAFTYQGSLMFSAARSWAQHQLGDSSGSWIVTIIPSMYDSTSF
jgi:hypothetical protein